MNEKRRWGYESWEPKASREAREHDLIEELKGLAKAVASGEDARSYGDVWSHVCAMGLELMYFDEERAKELDADPTRK